MLQHTQSECCSPVWGNYCSWHGSVGEGVRGKGAAARGKVAVARGKGTAARGKGAAAWGEGSGRAGEGGGRAGEGGGVRGCEGVLHKASTNPLAALEAVWCDCSLPEGENFI